MNLGSKGWAEAGSCAKDREAWRQSTQGPQREKDKMMMKMQIRVLYL